MNLESDLFKNQRSLASNKEGDFLDVEQKDKIKREKVTQLMKKIREKKMEKVNLAFSLISSGLPFDHDFIQGYLTYDSDYFVEGKYDDKNLELLEKVVDDFDFKRDHDKMLPFHESSKN